jgi:glutamate synthase (NADPH) large chain
MTTRPLDFSGLMPPERDACAIISYINKVGQPTHGNVQRTIEALMKMGHRAGEISGEGDGCGKPGSSKSCLWRRPYARRWLPNKYLTCQGKYIV